MENLRHHIGGGEPYKEKQEREKNLAQQIAELEEQITEARKQQNATEAERLRVQREELLAQQRQELQTAADSRERRLKEEEQE
ncbi:MAG: hypothetical protein Q8P76_01020 [bacterium]|nr:hypothetical protein [bacterium]